MTEHANIKLKQLLESDAQIQSILSRLNANPRDEQLLKRALLAVRRAGKRLQFDPKHPKHKNHREVMDVRTVDQINPRDWKQITTDEKVQKISPKTAPSHRYLFVLKDSFFPNNYDPNTKKLAGGLDYWLAEEIASFYRPKYYATLG